MIKNTNKKRGVIIVQTMVFSAIVIVIISALASWAATTIKAGRIAFNQEQAFQAAESGIDYYRWHLAHASSDFQDGTGTTGPYVHQLKYGGVSVGQFSLDITPPTTGSTLVTITSSGSSVNDSSYIRKIESSVAKPSIAKYALAANDSMRVGVGTTVNGPIFVNGGIRFDGLAKNIVSSFTTSYTDDDSDACTKYDSWGVHTCVYDTNGDPDPTYDTTLPSRTDVFQAGRQIGQPELKFTDFSSSISTLETKAKTSDGFYLNSSNSGNNGNKNEGYHIVLKTDGTFDLSTIKTWVNDNDCNGGNSWSINTETTPVNHPFPVNGIIFVKDDLVVEGKINGARLTIAAADTSANNTSDYKNIIINNDLTYTKYDGTDVIGLIAQNNILAGLHSEDDLKIDAALVVQYGKIGRPYYRNQSGNGNSCAYTFRSTISLYGMLASNQRYGFQWGDNTGKYVSGYDTRNITYDGHLLLAPPPSFLLISDQYKIQSWQEVR